MVDETIQKNITMVLPPSNNSCINHSTGADSRVWLVPAYYIPVADYRFIQHVNQ